MRGSSDGCCCWCLRRQNTRHCAQLCTTRPSGQQTIWQSVYHWPSHRHQELIRTSCIRKRRKYPQDRAITTTTGRQKTRLNRRGQQQQVLQSDSHSDYQIASLFTVNCLSFRVVGNYYYPARKWMKRTHTQLVEYLMKEKINQLSTDWFVRWHQSVY